ncbi:MAG: YidC/Oxa1 family membrane protein insertase [Eubacterium sp.]|nr:YidC/Oxa1 family membrane protein insertase [Eubacterium sp.]
MFDWLFWIFGKILFGIDWVVSHTFGFYDTGFHNTGLCIILFTIVIYLILYPLNSKQQKSSRLMNKINPEIKEIQKKYKGKTDQASQMKMNQETQAVYAKYGISPFSGCLPLLITLPIMFCLYRVMYDIKFYIPALAEGNANIFLGLDIDVSPLDYFNSGEHRFGWIAFIIPVLAVLFQFLNTKILQVKTDDKKGEQDSMASSMKMMNYFMPFMSGFFCLSLPMYIGLYWITGSIFRVVQGILVNRKVDKISMEELIEKNKAKASKKSAKQEAMNRQMEEYAKKKTAGIKTATSYQNNASSKESNEEVKINKNIEPGSIAGYAHMLSGKKDKK